MKKLVIIMAVLALAGGVVIALLLFKGITSIGAGMIASTDSFMVAARAGDYAAAEKYLSETFRAANNQESVRAFMKSSRLDQYSEASWTSRKITNKEGWLEGTVTTKTGGTIPLKMSFVEEQKTWKILSIDVNSGPSIGGNGSSVAAMPTNDQQVALVRQSFHDFDKALGEKSMLSFHTTLARPFQEQYPVERLDSIYHDFYGLPFDWSQVDRLKPAFDTTSAIDADGVLLLEGHFATSPNRLSFRQRYLWEANDWKLIGFTLNVGTQ